MSTLKEEKSQCDSLNDSQVRKKSTSKGEQDADKDRRKTQVHPSAKPLSKMTVAALPCPVNKRGGTTSSFKLGHDENGQLYNQELEKCLHLENFERTSSRMDLNSKDLGTHKPAANDCFELSPLKKGHFEAPQISILVVDDIKSNVKLACMILEKAGYTCDTAYNGFDAVEMAKKKHYHLILMDNVMPVMCGVEAAQAILAFDNAVPIIGLTGNVLQSDQNEFLKAGVKMVALKPIDKAQLLKICETYIQQ